MHICHVDAMPVPQLELTELDSETAYAEVLMEKPQWKAYVKGAGETNFEVQTGGCVCGRKRI